MVPRVAIAISLTKVGEHWGRVGCGWLGDWERACVCSRGPICAPPLARTCHAWRTPPALATAQGMRVRPDGPQLISELVRKELGIDCSVSSATHAA